MEDDTLSDFERDVYENLFKGAIQIRGMMILLGRKHVVFVGTMKLLLQLLREKEVLSADDLSSIEKTFSGTGLMNVQELVDEINNSSMVENIIQAAWEARFDSMLQDVRCWQGES